MRLHLFAAIFATCALTFAGAAHADDSLAFDHETAVETLDAKSEAPSHAFTYDARGTTKGHYGANAYAQSLSGTSQNTLGGGISAWGAPIDRLTIVADAQRSLTREFSPSAALFVRIFGGLDGASLSLLGKYKVERFAHGPNHELESEIESGVAFGYHHRALHVDLNAITGFGLGDDGEIDGEGRARIGLDVTSLVRVGLDGQGRWRLHGAEKLPGSRTWDFAAGPQIVLGNRQFYAALTAGPTTMAVVDRKAGWFGFASLGGLL